ncbi:MAG: hypothetical protein ABI534_10040 [Chloroflexota bacterium]
MEDLGFTSDDLERSLDELAAGSSDAAKFIRTFTDKRGTDPVDEDSIEDLASGRIPMHPLRRGERIRGLTWLDRDTNVVWLVAAHFDHRSGERGDSYAYFRALRADQLLPEELDYRLFREQQAIQAADAILDSIDPALRSALADPNAEVRVDIGGVPVRLLVARATPPPPRVKVAVSMHRTDTGFEPPPWWIPAILARCFRRPFAGWDDLPYSDDRTFGSRKLGHDEMAFESFVTDAEGL